MLQNLLFAAVMIGALRVKIYKIALPVELLPVCCQGQSEGHSPLSEGHLSLGKLQLGPHQQPVSPLLTSQSSLLNPPAGFLGHL